MDITFTTEEYEYLYDIFIPYQIEEIKIRNGRKK